MNYKIACVIVTYNRKTLLKKCLDAINAQKLKPHTVYIVDNASTDGTKDSVIEWGYYNIHINDIQFKYLLLQRNTGGAGGFYNGMKTAYDSEVQFDGIWVMDDDGIPAPNCLENLLKYMPQYHQVGPMVLSIEDDHRLAFNNHGSFSVQELLNKGELIEGYMCPFNAILYSRELIKKVGFPMPELFIWGDETNYTMRCRNAGYNCHTITSAIHHHPADRMKVDKTIFGRNVVEVPNKWKGYCYWRNTIYNHHKEMSFRSLIRFYFYNGYYVLAKYKSWSWFKCFNKAFLSGFKKTPDSGYKQYIK